MIKVVICDDIPQVTRHLAQVINSADDMQVVGTANSGESGVEMVKETSPDVVLMDVQMETEEAGIAATKKIVEYDSFIKVVIITVHEEEDIMFKAYASGAVGYILKTDEEEQIVKSIREVNDNEMFIRPYAAKKIIEEFTKLQKHQSSIMFIITMMSRLTKSELEILKMVYDGVPRKTIAQKRYVELTTINTQIRNIMNKLGYHSVLQMCAELRQLQIFDIMPK